MEFNLLLLILILVAIGVAYYFYNILKNYLVLTFISLISIYLINKYTALSFSWIETFIIVFVVLGIYTLLEILNIFLNVYEVIKEILNILLYPFKIMWNALSKIFKDENKKERDEEKN